MVLADRSPTHTCSPARQVKELLEKFKFVSKNLQFWRFLVLKIPEVSCSMRRNSRHIGGSWAVGSWIMYIPVMNL